MGEEEVHFGDLQDLRPSLADRDTKWNAFQSDPDWIAARTKSEEDGPIVGNITSQLLVPTGFSSVK